MKTIIIKTLMAILAGMGFAHNALAQEKPASPAGRLEKTTETFNVEDGVSVEIDGSFTTFIIETWNPDSPAGRKGQVLVEAFIEIGEDLSEEEKQQIMESWDLSVMGNSNKIQISSGGNRPGFAKAFTFDTNGNYAYAFPQMENMLSPMLENLSQIQVIVPPTPVLPPDFYENMGELSFDYEAYKENGEAYVKEYEKQIKEKFGEDFQKTMKEWGEQFAERMAKRREELGQRREELLERRESMEEKRQKMAERQKEMAERMEEMAEHMQKKAAHNPNAKFSKNVSVSPNGGKTVSWTFSNSMNWSSENNIKKTVIVHLPEDTKLNLDIRHGKIEMEGKVNNLRAKLSHTPLTAKEIEGKETQIHASYAPVKIENWDYGSLSLSYGECTIENVHNIKLVSNMSDLKIGNIGKSGILRGSFGQLTIEKVGKDFESLDIDLQNSELNLQLPDTAFDFDYDGEHSNIDLPPSLKVESRENYGQTYISGYNRSENNSGQISIEADFSEVRLRD